jgi:hypothetical protein
VSLILTAIRDVIEPATAALINEIEMQIIKANMYSFKNVGKCMLPPCNCNWQKNCLKTCFAFCSSSTRRQQQLLPLVVLLLYSAQTVSRVSGAVFKVAFRL